VAGNYELHIRTLPQVSDAFQIDGAWPGAVTLRRGWNRAIARPWNAATGFGALRLVRGNTAFLSAATEWTGARSNDGVFSPALYASATRIWEKVGYRHSLELTIMEKLLHPAPAHSDRVTVYEDEGLSEIELLDRATFDEFWQMDAAGLQEAISATRRTRIFAATVEGEISGYAIVGLQLGISFLQRIAVTPDRQGLGLGGELLDAAMDWALRSGASTMVLNVRTDNVRAQKLYARHRFADTGATLRVLRYDI
jgi:ribosomal protein S18 acetylase RimI-like enzyme